jgi:hypothetical protein
MAEQPNARHHPPQQTVISDKFSMKVPLFAVGCMPLLGAALALTETHLPSATRKAKSCAVIIFPFTASSSSIILRASSSEPA